MILIIFYHIYLTSIFLYLSALNFSFSPPINLKYHIKCTIIIIILLCWISYYFSFITLAWQASTIVWSFFKFALFQKKLWSMYPCPKIVKWVIFTNRQSSKIIAGRWTVVLIYVTFYDIILKQTQNLGMRLKQTRNKLISNIWYEDKTNA